MARYGTAERHYIVTIGVVLRDDDVLPEVILSNETIRWMQRRAAESDPQSSEKVFQDLLKAHVERRQQLSGEIIYEEARFRHWSWGEAEEVRERCTVQGPSGREVSPLLWRKEVLRRLLLSWSVEVEDDSQVIPVEHQDSDLGTRVLSDRYYNLITRVPVLAPIIDGLLYELNCRMSGIDEEESEKNWNASPAATTAKPGNRQ